MSRIQKIKNGRHIVTLFTAVILIISMNPDIHAQGHDSEVVRGALERTTEVIAEARPIIMESRSSTARLALERAISLQTRATSMLSAERNQFAYKYTMEARSEAWKAIAIARKAARIEDKLVSIAENTQERLIRLREQVIESGIRDERLNRLMMEAREQLDKARTNAQQLKDRLAINFAENARNLSRQAEKRFRRLLSDQELIQRRLTLMENLALRARERLSSGDNSGEADILEKAEDQLSRARALAGEGNFNAARLMMERCERLLRAIARDAAGSGQLDGHRFMAETERLMERAREMISSADTDSDNDPAILEEAETLMQRAREMLAAGRVDEARGILNRVRNMLRHAVDSARPGQDTGVAEKEIDGVIDLRDSVEEIVSDCSAPGARKLFARAENRLGSAMDHFEEGRIDRAYAEARIARNLFRRIREICSE